MKFVPLIHRRVNQCSGSDPLDSDIPLFAYKEDNCWISLLKSTFLQITTNIYSMEGLDVVHRHSYCISGTLWLLLDGVTPETVMKIGGWSSLCFLIYWHPLEQIILLAVTQSWDAKKKKFRKKFAHHENVDDGIFQWYIHDFCITLLWFFSLVCFCVAWQWALRLLLLCSGVVVSVSLWSLVLRVSDHLVSELTLHNCKFIGNTFLYYKESLTNTLSTKAAPN